MVPQKSIIKTHYRNGPFHYSRGTPPEYILAGAEKHEICWLFVLFGGWRRAKVYASDRSRNELSNLMQTFILNVSFLFLIFHLPFCSIPVLNKIRSTTQLTSIYV